MEIYPTIKMHLNICYILYLDFSVKFSLIQTIHFISQHKGFEKTLTCSDTDFEDYTIQ